MSSRRVFTFYDQAGNDYEGAQCVALKDSGSWDVQVVPVDELNPLALGVTPSHVFLPDWGDAPSMRVYDGSSWAEAVETIGNVYAETFWINASNTGYQITDNFDVSETLDNGVSWQDAGDFQEEPFDGIYAGAHYKASDGTYLNAYRKADGTGIYFVRAATIGGDWDITWIPCTVRYFSSSQNTNIVEQNGHIFILYAEDYTTNKVLYSHDNGATWDTATVTNAGSDDYFCMCLAPDCLYVFTIDATVYYNTVLREYRATDWDTGPTFALAQSLEEEDLDLPVGASPCVKVFYNIDCPLTWGESGDRFFIANTMYETDPPYFPENWSVLEWGYDGSQEVVFTTSPNWFCGYQRMPTVLNEASGMGRSFWW